MAIIEPILDFIIGSWWLWTFIILLPICRSTWLFWRQTVFEHDLKWVLLEIKMPRIVERSPRAMDQVVQAIHGLMNAAGDLQELYWDGEITRWYTLEIISFGGEIHFYVRCYKKQKALIESAFFAFYPEVELDEVDDYAHTVLPHSYADLVFQGKELWGTELILDKEPIIPIKSYQAFENIQEPHQLDPISGLMESLSKIKKEEFLGIQINIQPKHRSLWGAFSHEVDELRQPKRVKAAELMEDVGEGEMTFSVPRSPGQTDVLKAVENNMSKPPFEVIPRFIYVSPRTIYSDSFARRAVTGAFNQYADANLNYFKRNEAISTRVKIWNFPFIFPNARQMIRQQRLYKSYLHREFFTETKMGRFFSSHILHFGWHSKPIILSSESIATLFHPPSNLVLTAPHTPRVESRKMAAPAGLNIYGDEKELDKFK